MLSTMLSCHADIRHVPIIPLPPAHPPNPPSPPYPDPHKNLAKQIISALAESESSLNIFISQEVIWGYFVFLSKQGFIFPRLASNLICTQGGP